MPSVWPMQCCYYFHYKNAERFQKSILLKAKSNLREVLASTPSALPSVHYLQIDLGSPLCVGSRLFISSCSPHWLLQQSTARDDWPQRGNQMSWGLNSKMTIFTAHCQPSALQSSPGEWNYRAHLLFQWLLYCCCFSREWKMCVLKKQQHLSLMIRCHQKSNITPTCRASVALVLN